MSGRRFRVGERELLVDAQRKGSSLRVQVDEQAVRTFIVRRVGSAEFVLVDPNEPGSLHSLYAMREGDIWWVHLDGRTWRFEAIVDRGRGAGGSGELAAPIPATVTEVLVAVGDTVTGGDVLVVLSAMKMQLEVRAPHDGEVAEVFFAVGDQVDGGVQLLRIEAAAGD